MDVNNDSNAADRDDTTNENRPAWIEYLKELMAAAIALPIVAISLWMVGSLFVASNTIEPAVANDAQLEALHDEAYERRKDLMQIGLTLVGTVLGYYFGRVPAENRAKHAEAEASAARTTTERALDQAGEARTTAATAHRKLEDARATVGRVEAALAGPGQVPGAPQIRTLSGGKNDNADAAFALAELSALRGRIG